MPKDDWRKVRDRDVANLARLDYAANDGTFRRFESVFDDLRPAANEERPARKTDSTARGRSKRQRSPRVPLIAARSSGSPLLYWLNSVRRQFEKTGTVLPVFERELTRGDEAAVPLLVFALSQSGPADVPHLVRATKQVGAPAIDAIAALLRGSNILLAVKAADLLGRLGGEVHAAARSALKLAAGSSDKTLRRTASIAFQRLCSSRIGPNT